MTRLFELIVVQGLSATPLVEAGDPATLVNTDSSQSIVLDDESNVLTTDPKPFIGPGQRISFNGNTDVYGIAPPNSPVTVLKFPGGTNVSESIQTPTANPPKIAFQNIGSGNTVDLVGSALNPGLMAVQLLTCSISSFLAGTPASSFNSQDAIQDDLANVILGQQVGLSNTGGQIAPTLSQDMKETVIGPGRKIRLSNGGGGGGILHQCAATVTYYLIGDPP